jgi:hypothetical protein
LWGIESEFSSPNWFFSYVRIEDQTRDNLFKGSKSLTTWTNLLLVRIESSMVTKNWEKKIIVNLYFNKFMIY